MNNQLLREIPKVDDLLRSPTLASVCADIPHGALVEAVRGVLAELRSGVLAGTLAALPGEAELAQTVATRARRASLPSLRGVVNGTGVILHTNLGRACLSKAAADAAAAAAQNYSTLEYDRETGKRGERYAHVEKLLTALTCLLYTSPSPRD